MRSPPCRARSPRGGCQPSGAARSRSWPEAAPVAPRAARLRGTRRRARIKHLVHFAVDDALLVIAARIAADHAAPEAHRIGVAQVFGDLPAPGEAIQDQLDRAAPD